MSYTKITFDDQFLKPISNIQKETLKSNDITDVLERLNTIMGVSEKIINVDKEIGELWNEIISDLLASIYSASSGFYRSAIIVLRSVLEIGCTSFFYYDHKIEYKMFKAENLKADKYVSTLVNDYDFFTTRYIKSFYPQIEEKQKSVNSISDALKKLYGELSDSLHGRYNNLTKLEGLEIKYDKIWFDRYKKHLFSVLSILTVLYTLRFNDAEDEDIIRLANQSKAVVL